MTSKYSILYVDDEKHNLHVFNASFFKYYKIITALSGTEALEILQKETVHLIITDERMPNMTGLEFLEEIANKYVEVPRIILTAYSDISVIIDAVNRCGIYQYVQKPWDRESLKLVIDNALQKYQLEIDKKQLVLDLEMVNQALEEKVLERTQELYKTNHELRSVNAVKDKLFSIIAHDLRSPLNTLSNFVNLLVDFEDAFSPEETKELASQIRDSLQNVNDLLNNLLYWSRNQMQTTHLDIREVDILDAIERAIRVTSHTAQQKYIKLKIDKVEQESVWADKNMVDVILRNLISNAIKFTHKNGLVYVSGSLEESFYRIDVVDTGVGMDEESLQKLFDVDQHITTYGTANEKGTGIGLKLCHEFAEKQGGKISAKSQVGQGSTFSVWLPIEKTT